MNIEIRKASVEDAKDMADINIIEWKTTYKDLLPEWIFEKREENREERIEKMGKSIKEKDNVYVAVVDGKVVGFASYGKSPYDDYSTSGQVYACYILDEYHNLGIGRMLVVKAMEELVSDGYTTLVTGCLDGNPANEFHKSIGGVYEETIDFEVYDYKAKENLYFHEDLAKSLEMNKEKLNKRR